VAIERVGLPGDLVEPIGQTLARRRGRDAPGDRRIALDRAEFLFQIGLAIDAFARNPRVEKIGPPAHLDRDIRAKRQGLFQPALADEAPRTDDIGDDLDRHRGGERRGCGGGRQGGHDRDPR